MEVVFLEEDIQRKVQKEIRAIRTLAGTDRTEALQKTTQGNFRKEEELGSYFTMLQFEYSWQNIYRHSSAYVWSDRVACTIHADVVPVPPAAFENKYKVKRK